MERFVAILLLCCSFLGCGSPSTREDSSAGGGQRRSTKLARIVIDPRVELLSAVNLLSGQEWCTEVRHDTSEYERELLRALAPYRNHQIVEVFRTWRNFGFLCDMVPAFSLHYSQPPELSLIVPFGADRVTRGILARDGEAFLSSLRKFSQDCGWQNMFAMQRGLYDMLIAAVRDSLGGGIPVEPVDEYFGIGANTYSIVLMPLAPNECGVVRLPASNNTSDIYSLIGYSAIQDRFPVFGPWPHLRSLILRQFYHAHVDSMAAQYRQRVEQFQLLYDRIAIGMEKQGYRSWETALNEHVVRAVAIRLASRFEGIEVANQMLEADRADGFAYIEPMLWKLAEYERERDRYPTFADFYPKFLDVLLELTIQNR
jgi:hypothetical protein